MTGALALVSGLPLLTECDGCSATTDRKLVVVIDDDPLVLEAMAGLFRSWNYHLLVAGTDDEALARPADCDSPPDLIVSDYHLPGEKNQASPQVWRPGCPV